MYARRALSQYQPLVKPPVPEGLALSDAGKILANIPFLGWSWEGARWNSRWRPTFERLRKQLNERQPPLPEAWGNDSRRRELAAFIAHEAQDKFGWPNDYFIPEDSFWVMMFPPRDDLCSVEMIMDIEDRLEKSLTEREVVHFGDMKFGQVVDFLLKIAGRDPVPLDGPDALEAQPCASASVFWQLRGFAFEHAGIARQDFRPKTPLRDAFRRNVAADITRFVARRFGVRQPARRRFLPYLPVFWSWLVLFASMAAAIRLWAGSLFWYWIFLAPLPLGIIVARLSSWRWQRRLVTVADLVRWILRERQRQRDRVRPSIEAGRAS